MGIHRIQWKSNKFNGNPQNSNGIPWKSGENPWDLMEIHGIQGKFMNPAEIHGVRWKSLESNGNPMKIKWKSLILSKSIEIR